MARATLTRRILSVAAGVAIGTAGMLAGTTAAAAAAQNDADLFETPALPDLSTFSELPDLSAFVEGEEGPFLPVCGGTTVALIFPPGPDVAWTVEADGKTFWPVGEVPEAPHLELVFVPAEAGEIVVTATLAEGPTWQWEYTWEETFLPCDELPAPTFTEASCDTAATVTVPGLENFGPGDDELRPVALLQRRLPTELDNRVPELQDFIAYRLNGATLELGETRDLTAGDHLVTFHLILTEDLLPPSDDFPLPADFVFDLPLAGWTVEVPELDCEEPGDESGTGGELPVTGTTATLIAGGAVLLLGLGAGAYLIARRRRVTFTA